MLKLSNILAAIASVAILLAVQPSFAAGATAPYEGSQLRDMPTILDVTGRYGVKMGGNHFLTSSAGTQESFPRETQVTTKQTVSIPAGAIVKYAFIYYGGIIGVTDSEGKDFTADKVGSGTQVDGLNDINQVKGNSLTFKINSTQYTHDVDTRQPSGQSSIGSTAIMSQDFFTPHYGTLTGTKTSFWSNRLDITGLMQNKTGDVIFEVNPPERLDVNVNSSASNGGNPAGSTMYNSCLGTANWAVVVVYEDPSLPKKQIIIKDDIVRAWDYVYIHKGVWQRPQIKFTHSAMQAGAKFYVIAQTGNYAGINVTGTPTCGCGCGGTYYLKKTPTAGTDKPSQYWSNTLVDPPAVKGDPAHKDSTNGPWTLTQRATFGSTVKRGNDWTLFQSGSKFTEFPNLYEGRNQAADNIDAVTAENNDDATNDKFGHPWNGRGAVKYHGWGNDLSAVEVVPDAANLATGSTETSFYFKGDQKDVFKPQERVTIRMLALEIPLETGGPTGSAPVVSGVATSVSGTSVTVTGTASDVDNDLNKVEIEFDNGGTWITASGAANWSTTQTLGNGDHTVRARGTDNAGNVSSPTAAVSFQIGTPPTFSAPVVDSITASVNGTNVTVSGTASDADNDLSKVELQFDNDGNWLSTSGAANWSLTKGMSVGSHTAVAKATDAGGHASATKSVNFTINSPPTGWICKETTANNVTHVLAGRATVNLFFKTIAKGSKADMGYYNFFITTKLAETSSGYFVIGSCP